MQKRYNNIYINYSMWESITQKNTYFNIKFCFCGFSALGTKTCFFLCLVFFDMETEIKMCPCNVYKCFACAHCLIQKYN